MDEKEPEPHTMVGTMDGTVHYTLYGTWIYTSNEFPVILEHDVSLWEKVMNFEILADGKFANEVEEKEEKKV